MAINMSHTYEEFLRAQGFWINKPIIAGSGIQRFRTSEHKNKGEPCWALLFPEGDAGVWGDWRDHNRNYWRSDGKILAQLSKEERAEVSRKQAIALTMLEEEKERLSIDSLAKWNAIEEGIQCEYLVRKKVKAHGIKIGLDGNAYVPARDVHGKFWNYQNISASPKMFKRGRTSGCYHLIEGNREQIILASGYATAASIHEATGLCVLVCFGDNNIFTVAKLLKEAGWLNLRAAVDNDSDGSLSGNKIGARIADELGLIAIMPNESGDFNDLACLGKSIYQYFYTTTPVFSFGELLADDAPMPEDIIHPRVLTEGGMIVFGGAPKVGKSDFMLTWLVHHAGGIPFMGMTPPRPLRIFYLQAEVQYHYLRERVKMVDIHQDAISDVEKNLFITPQVRMLLDEEGVKIIGNTIRQCFGEHKPDIICIDPIANVYDQESENDNAQMMKFLSQRVESLRQYASEKTGFILIHHTKKIAKDELAKDPFQMFSGASSLRRYYTTGMLMYRPDEEVSECVLTYEVRNGPRIKNINIDKNYGRWEIIDPANTRIAKPEDNTRFTDEHARKVQIIKSELAFEIENGKQHTVNSLAFLLDHKSGLGSSKTIERLLKGMLAQDEIQPLEIDGSNKVFLQL